VLSVFVLKGLVSIEVHDIKLGDVVGGMDFEEVTDIDLDFEL